MLADDKDIESKEDIRDAAWGLVLEEGTTKAALTWLSFFKYPVITPRYRHTPVRYYRKSAGVA